LGDETGKRRKKERTSSPEELDKILDGIRTKYNIKTELFKPKTQQSNQTLTQAIDSNLNPTGWLRQQQIQKQNQDILNQQTGLAKKQQEEWRRQQEQRRRRQ
jgi:hypothetical protein